jgi:hypothetical protein
MRWRARQMGARARQRIEERFSIDAMVRAFSHFYRSLHPAPLPGPAMAAPMNTTRPTP